MARLRARRFSSTLVPFILELLRKQGVDPSPLERAYLHLSPTGEGAVVGLAEIEGLFERAATLTKDPDFGLHSALAMPRGGYGLVEFALRSAPTVRVAVEQLGRFGALINPLVRWSAEVDGDEVTLRHQPQRQKGVGRQANVFTVVRILQIAREMAGTPLSPRRVWFAHDDRAPSPALHAFLGATHVSFGRGSNGVCFAASDLEVRPTAADPELNRALETHHAALVKTLALDDVLERTRAVLRAALPEGPPTLATVARRLHVGGRSLQRRLADEGTSFAGLVTEERRARAERLLETSDLPVGQVAKAVGYRDVPAFVRAFKGWTGLTPGAFREQA